MRSAVWSHVQGSRLDLTGSHRAPGNAVFQVLLRYLPFILAQFSHRISSRIKSLWWWCSWILRSQPDIANMAGWSAGKATKRDPAWKFVNSCFMMIWSLIAGHVMLLWAVFLFPKMDTIFRVMYQRYVVSCHACIVRVVEKICLQRISQALAPSQRNELLRLCNASPGWKLERAYVRVYSELLGEKKELEEKRVVAKTFLAVLVHCGIRWLTGVVESHWVDPESLRQSEGVYSSEAAAALLDCVVKETLAAMCFAL